MSKPNKHCQNKEWLYDQYITQGKTTYEISQELSCGASTVQHWLRRHEIPIRDCSSCHLESSAQLLGNEDWLRDQYLVQIKSASKIASEIGCQQETVSRYLHKYNIPLRTQSEEIGGERHPLYGTHHSEETRKKISESVSGPNHPNFGKKSLLRSAKMSGSGNPRYGVKLSERQIEQQRASLLDYYDKHPEVIIRLSETRKGKNGPNWRGGISFEPYCPKFNSDLKERVRAFFDYKCITCGKTTEENGEQLAVHHVEYDKSACCHGRPVHFAAMCHRCHSITNFHREEWESMLHRIIDEIYNGRSYYTKEEYNQLKLKPKYILRRDKDNYDK
jgi:hypothetical protein